MVPVAFNLLPLCSFASGGGGAVRLQAGGGVVRWGGGRLQAGEAFRVRRPCGGVGVATGSGGVGAGGACGHPAHRGEPVRGQNCSSYCSCSAMQYSAINISSLMQPPIGFAGDFKSPSGRLERICNFQSTVQSTSNLSCNLPIDIVAATSSRLTVD